MMQINCNVMNDNKQMHQS